MNESPKLTLRASAIYHYGTTNLAKTEPVMLEWTSDGFLRIWREPAGGVPEDIARLSPAEITKVSGQVVRLVIHTSNATHRLDIVADSSVNPSVGLPADQVVEQMQQYKAVNMSEWVDSFRKRGVKVIYLNLAKTWLLSGAVAFVIILAALIYAIVVS